MTNGTPQRSWVVSGGGTGGHVTPALALAERIAARGDAVVIVGGEHGLERHLVPDAGFELVSLPSRQVMGTSALARARAIPAMLRACLAARRLLRRRGIDIVVSVGGYASVPTAVAAAVSRVPLALVEPNAVPGRANRLAARWASRIFAQFEEAATVFVRSSGADRVRTPGVPLRAALLEAFARQEPRRIPAVPIRLLVFGGSQGAGQLNEAMIGAAHALDAQTLEVFHQTGEADRERVAQAYAEARIEAEVVAFESDMPRRYRWADVALCRSGALTVAELALAGLPALLVPYPHAADDHQRANARALADAGGARLLDSTTFSAQTVAAALAQILAEPEELRSMSACASKLARPDAADRIVDECAALLSLRAGS